MAEELCIENLRDRPLWLPLIAAWHHREWLATVPDADLLSPEEVADKLLEREHTLTRHIESDSLPCTWVASEGGRPVGTVSVVFYQFTQSDVATEWLTNLFVLPECRRQGIASRLLDCAVHYARSQKLRRLLLYTDNQLQFYRKRQWRAINRGRIQGRQVDIMGFDLSH